MALTACVLAALILSACTGASLDVNYTDAVEEFYGDGMSLAHVYSAPESAAEFKSNPRVYKRIMIDNRINGSHITGLYLPKGESVTVTIPEQERTSNHSVTLIASDGELIKEVGLTQPSLSISAGDEGGILLFNIGARSVDTQLKPFLVTFDGAMQSPYYRYGLDSEDDLSDCASYGDIPALIDGGNIRFYIPCSSLKQVKSLKEAISWWRSVCGYIKLSISQNRMDGNNSPVRVYFTDKSNDDCDVHMAEDSLTSLFDINKLGNTDAGLDVMLSVARCESDKSGISVNAAQFSQELAELAAYNSYMFHKDYFNIFDSASDKSGVFFSNGYSVLKSIDSGLADDDKTLYALLCFMHSFGTDKMSQFIDTFTQGSEFSGYDRIVSAAADVFGIDASTFISQVCGVTPGDKVVSYAGAYDTYIPIFNYYTRVCEGDNYGIGKRVYFGYASEFDFRATTEVYGGSVVSATVSDNSGNWTAQGGVHIYKSSSEYVSDGYSLTIDAVADGKAITCVSYGAMSVNVDAAQYTLYSDVPYRTMEDAIKGYSSATPSYATALDKAVCGIEAYAEEDDNTKYSFAVTRFNFEPTKDGTYRFYLVNTTSGFCYYRVVFGVGDYSAVMFDGNIPVIGGSYALYKSEDLKGGYVYNFAIYMLQPEGANGSSLLVSEDGGKTMRLITADDMSYPGTKKSDMRPYKSPIYASQGLAYPDNLYIDADNSAWRITEGGSGYRHYGGDLSLLNNGKTVGGAHVCQFEFYDDASMYVDAQFETIREINYVRIYGIIEDVDVRLRLTNIKGEYEYVELSGVDNAYNANAYMARCDGIYVAARLEFNGKGTAQLSELTAGIMMEDCVYVPHSSTSIWYEGHWMRKSGCIAVNGGINQNTADKSHLEYSFYGDSVALLAAIGPEYGSAKIYLDNKLYDTVSFNSETVEYQRVLLYKVFDKLGTHTVRIEPVKGNTVNIDAIVYTTQDYVPGEKAIPFNPYYLLAIPAIIAAGIIICASLDLAGKGKAERALKATARKKLKESKQSPAQEQSADSAASGEPEPSDTAVNK